MVLKAVGKYIDTLPITELLSQEEALADTVVFEVDRFHGSHDLSEFTFIMRGITESGGETETELSVDVEEQVLRLTWEISALFTAEAGTLALDLMAVRYGEGQDPSENPPTYVLRYQLPPVQVRGLPDADSVLDSQSYTAFLLEVRASANDAVAMINKLTADFETESGQLYAERIEAMEQELKAMRDTVDYDHNMIIQLISQVTQNTQSIMELQSSVQDATPIVELSQEEFDALDSPETGTLYVITQ
jgi:hypothetical protein